MTSLFEMQFFQNAFLMSLMLGFLFGLLSFFVVLRKMAFLGAGIAHTAFGGIAIGIFLGINPFYSSLVFCTFSAILINRLVRYGRISYDTGIGIFFSFSMALGALFIALKKAYTFDLKGYLFGNILGVSDLDILLTLIILFIFIPFVSSMFQKILFMSFDEKVAEVSGIHTQRLDTLLSVFLVAIIVVSIKIVGIILVSALVVLPASFGLLFFKNYRSVIFCSILYTLITMMSGLFLSYFLDFPTGATMVILGTILYFTAVLVLRLIKIK